MPGAWDNGGPGREVGSFRIRCIATSPSTTATAVNNTQQIFGFAKMAGREDAAKHYLNQHRIPELLQNVTSALVFARPGT